MFEICAFKDKKKVYKHKNIFKILQFNCKIRIYNKC